MTILQVIGRARDAQDLHNRVYGGQLSLAALSEGDAVEATPADPTGIRGLSAPSLTVAVPTQKTRAASSPWPPSSPPTGEAA